MDSVTFDAVKAARERLDGVVHRTPVMTSQSLNAIAEAGVFLKCENFQRAGAFKIRGAYNAQTQLAPQQRRAGAIAYSSGNHAQAMALAGQLLDIPVVVVMPMNAPAVKLAATRGYGAEIVTYDPGQEEREDVAERVRAERGLTLIPPFDHPDVIAGQGTAACELVEDAGPLDWIVAPCGGGGLLSGTAIAAKALLPGIRVAGVEPEGANNGGRAFRAGEIVRVDRPDTFADGLRPKALGEHTFAAIRQHVDLMCTVSEAEIRATLEFLWTRMKLVVEPSGAVGLAAVYHGKLPLDGEAGGAGAVPRIGVILSGGNADIGAVADWLRSGPGT